MFWGMWEKVKTVGKLEKSWGAPKLHEGVISRGLLQRGVRLRLQDAIYRLQFYSNSLIHILSLSNSHNIVASIQKNWGDKSHRLIVSLIINYFTNTVDRELTKLVHIFIFGLVSMNFQSPDQKLSP